MQVKKRRVEEEEEEEEWGGEEKGTRERRGDMGQQEVKQVENQQEPES